MMFHVLLLVYICTQVSSISDECDEFTTCVTDYYDTNTCIELFEGIDPCLKVPDFTDINSKIRTAPDLFEGDMRGVVSDVSNPVHDLNTLMKNRNNFFESLKKIIDLEALGLSFDSDTDEPPPGFYAAERDTKHRWPGGVVYYVIADDYPASQLNTIRQAMNTIEANSCISFQKKHRTAQHWLLIHSGQGCWSWVGRNYKQPGEQQLSLQKNDDDGWGCIYKGTIMHELMHALGFYHEQSRADRDEYVTIDRSAIDTDRVNNFKKYTLEEITHLGQPYDYGSIMHYGSHAFASGAQPSVIPKDENAQIGQRQHLSEIDVRKINCYYKCASGCVLTEKQKLGSKLKETGARELEKNTRDGGGEETDGAHRCSDFSTLCEPLKHYCDKFPNTVFHLWIRSTCGRTCDSC